MTTYAPPPLWSSGVEWDGATAEWSGTLPSSGRPNLYVAINGELTAEARSGQWRLGRNDWFDVLTPSSASFSVVGTVTASPNDEIVVSTDSGVLWVGNIDEVSQVVDLTGTWTSITATDIIGRLGMTITPPGQLTVSGTAHRWMPVGDPLVVGPTLDEAAQYLIDTYASGSITITVGDSAGTLPALDVDWIDPPDVTLLEVLNTAEQSSNAMMALQPDGTIIVVMRDALVAASVAMTSLTGLDTPFTWSKSTSRSTVINHIVLEKPAYYQTTVLDTTDSASVVLYGDRTYAVDNFLCTTATHFSTALRTALASPRAIVTNGQFHVRDLSQGAIMLAPLSWVQYDGDTWQVMSVEHSVTPGDWTVTITADASQNAITGNAEPTPA